MLSTPTAAPLWKQEVNRRLAEHRNRRTQVVPTDEQPLAAKQASSRAADVAARVAARFAHTPSYAEQRSAPETETNQPFLSETMPVAVSAHFLAEVAPAGPAEPARFAAEEMAPVGFAPAERVLPAIPEPVEFTAVPSPVFNYEPLAAAPPIAAEPEPVINPWLFEPERLSSESAQAAEGNLIEFPRRARSRAAEANEALETGYVQELAYAVGGHGALSIFEVDPATVAVPSVLAESSYMADPTEEWIPLPTVSRWSGARQVAEEEFELAPDPVAPTPVMEAASMSLRLLAGAVDMSLVGLAFVGAATVAVSRMEQLPALRSLETGSALAIVLIGLIYLAAFSVLAVATPGMRYAGVALSNFDNRHPDLEQRLGRLGALLLSLAPLGLGVFWALFDEEGLGWHDRLSHTYPRKR